MFICSSVKGLFAFIAFIVICISHLDYAIISLVAQTIFSGSILADFAKQIIFYWRVKNVHDGFYRQFVTEGVVRSEQIHSLLENMIEYECLKSFYQVRLSQKIFYKLNPTLSSEWGEIAKKITIAPSIEKKASKL